MQGVVARRNNFTEPILEFFEEAYEEFGRLTGRHYGLVSQYKTDDADTVFVSLGSAAENIEAAVDYLREHAGREGRARSTSTSSVRSRRRPSSRRCRQEERHHPRAHRRAAGGRQPDGARHPHRAAQGAAGRSRAFRRITADQMPRLFGGVYGLGSRDFRPEHTLGAYEFAIGQARAQGRQARGRRRVVLRARRRSSLRGEVRRDAVAAARRRDRRAVPLGRRLGRDHDRQEPRRDHRRLERSALRARQGRRRVRQPEGNHPRQRESEVRIREEGRADLLLHGRRARAHPGELRSAPRQRRAVLRPEGVHAHQPARRHAEGGCLVWESEEEGEQAWERLPLWARQQIIDKKIRVFTLPGFEIARKATDRGDLQLRMQGNAFLGAFFAVSPLLEEFGITQEQFHEVVHKQYVKKFGRLGDAVVKSNMEVMTQGFERVQRDPDRRARRGRSVHACAARRCCPSSHDGSGNGQRLRLPVASDARGPGRAHAAHADRDVRRRVPRRTTATTSRPRRTPSLGIMAAGSGDTASKYVARRETPLYIAENCTQCMECIAVCPDTALPNCSQDLGHGAAHGGHQLRHRCRRAPEDVPVAAGDREAHARDDARRGREEREDAASGSDSRGHQRRRRVLARGQEPVLRGPRQGADGVPEDERDLRDAREEDARRGRRVLHLRLRPLQGLRGLRHRLRRASGAADGAGDRRGQRRARDGHGLPRPAARHAAEVPRPLQRRRGRRTRRPRRCATC